MTGWLHELTTVPYGVWLVFALGAAAVLGFIALGQGAVVASRLVADWRQRQRLERRFTEAMRTGGGRVELLPEVSTFTPLGRRPNGVIELPAGTTPAQVEEFARAFARGSRRVRRPRSMPSVAARRARRVHPR